ncbi:MAG: putative Ig domain-containing protein [Verrucomicrobiota bacterium]
MHVYDVDLDGNRLAVAGAFYGGVRVYDVANPSSPNLVAYYLPPSVAESVAIDGDRVFAALRNGGFAEFRITDYSPPTVAITQPASNPIVVQIPNINLSGTASDDVGVISVGWSNDAGGGGIASGTTSWSITDLPLQPGLNSLTISAVDSEGNIGSETIEVTFDDPKPTITSSLTTSGVYGQPFSYQISATNSPTSFDASNLPVGLSIDPSSGIISGTPAETLSADISISATNASGTGEATLVIEIDKITPSADWPAPASITYGTILNTAQLNATANVAGTFTYSPGTGTVLPYGVNQALSATFTPTDTEQYHSLSLQNSIDVIAQPGWFGRWADPQLMNPDGATDSGEHNWPEVVASPTGVWLAVWHGRENDALDFDAFISRSTDGGRTWTSPAFLNDDGASDSRTDTRPDLATDGNGRWVAVWRTTKPLSPTDHQRDVGIAFSISNDDGLTWSPFQPLSRYAVEGGNGKVDEEPRIATDGSGNWVVVWKSKRNPDGSLGVDRDIRAAYSTDDGASWSLPILVNSWGAMDADTDEDDQPEIAYGADGEWMVVWRSTYDHGPGAGTDTDIFFATSADVGATWSQPALVHAHGLTDGDDDDGVALVWAGDRWTVLWASDTWLVADGVDSDVVISVTTDSGATWSPPAPIHSYGSNDNRADGWPSVSYHPSDGLLVAWSSWVNHEGIIGTDPDILFTRSLDKGVTWEDFRVLNRNAYGDSGAQDLYPSLASDASGNVAVLWRSASILGTDLVGDWDIHFAHLRLTMSQLTNWLAGFYGHTPTDPSVLLPFSDSDGDGIMQIHEFSYGTNPLIAESEYSGESILPVAAVVDHGGSLYLEYTYRRRINPSAYGLSHALEVSSSLGSDSWSPAVLSGPEVVASNGDGLTESVTVRIEASSSAFFVRLRTTLDD